MSRAIFILVTGFCVVMNVLLWRAEFGSNKGRAAVPPQIVWEKILTAPDDSSLNVIYKGNRIGFCRWRTGVGEAWAKITDENIPSGLSQKSRGYNLRAEGSVILEEASSRLRFESDLQLDGRQQLRLMRTRVTVRPTLWDLTCVVSNQVVELAVDSDTGSFRRSMKVTDLKNPAAIAMELFQPLVGDWLAATAWTAGGGPNGSTMPSLDWDATTDWTQIGHTSVQIYRLHTRIMQHFDLNILVSRAGEILRIELPNETTLVNDQLHSL